MAPRAALLLVLVLIAVPDAMAQGFRCAPIREGDSAAALAKQLTGDARNRFSAWFQIMDPATGTFVPKAQYDHIRPGWHACLAAAPIATPPAQVASASVGDAIAEAFGSLIRLARRDPNLVLWLALVLAITLISSSVKEYFAARQQVPDVMWRFGESFAREFERPLLVPDDGTRAVRARLRADVPRRRLEVLLAPVPGRRYPNLSDHRKNVEYDVTRVLQRLRVPSVVGGVIYAQGQWVVVPFEFKDNSQQAGGK